MSSNPNARVFAGSLAALVLALSAAPASASLFAIEFTSGAGTTPGDLLSINQTTGAGTLVGTTNSVASLGLADRGNQLFTYDQRRDLLVELDPTSGGTIAEFDIGGGNLNGEGALSFRSDGIGFITFSTNQIATFDLNASTFTVIGNMGVQIDGLDFASDGTLFGLSQGTLGLYTINTATAAVSLIGDTGLDDLDGTAVAVLTFDSDGTLYAALQESLYTIDTVTAATTLVGGPMIASGSISGLSFLNVPEPASLALLALGLGLVSLHRRPVNSR